MSNEANGLFNTSPMAGELPVTSGRRPRCAQNWPAYNLAQTREKAMFQALLCDLCRHVPEVVQTFGRPRLSRGDMVFCAAFKIYSTVSGRRFMSDLEEAGKKEYISKVPHFNSVFNYLEDAELTPILQNLITRSSIPLKDVECDFAVDASGFSTCQFVKWFDARYGKERDLHSWIKVHLMCGVKTNIVTSVQVTGRHAHDSTMFGPLVETTAKHFEMKEISADKAYSSRANLHLVRGKGAVPYIPFKSNTTGAGDQRKGDDLWLTMWRYYTFHQEQFMAHYHKRSNVESTFSMIKAKFGTHLRSKSESAQVNEMLCKVLCHNICVLIQSVHELGIEATFGNVGEITQG